MYRLCPKREAQKRTVCIAFLGGFDLTERAGRCFRSVGSSALRNESGSRREGIVVDLKQSADLRKSSWLYPGFPLEANNDA